MKRITFLTLLVSSILPARICNAATTTKKIILLAEITSITGESPALMAHGRISSPDPLLNVAFRSGGYGDGYLPPGKYVVRIHELYRTEPSFTKDGIGFSFALSDKYDPRIGRTRTLLRIHPDGKASGSIGCVALDADSTSLNQFRTALAEHCRAGKVELHVVIRSKR
jgi:hypothetical protein